MAFPCLQPPSRPLPGRVHSSPERWPLSTRCTVRGSPKRLLNPWVQHLAVPSWRLWSWRRWSESLRSPTLQTGSVLACGFLMARKRWCSYRERDTTCKSTMWCWWRAEGPRTCQESNSKWSEENMTAATWWRRNSRLKAGGLSHALFLPRTLSGQKSDDLWTVHPSVTVLPQMLQRVCRSDFLLLSLWIN